MIHRKSIVAGVLLVLNLILYGFCFSQTQHFVFKDNTGDSYSIVVDSIYLHGQVFSADQADEIAVFTSNGLCVGASVLEEQPPYALTAWKDDPLTPQIDGYTSGDTMHFAFWGSSEGLERNADPSYKVGNGTFEYGFYSRLDLSLSSTNEVGETSEEISSFYILYQNRPNPFNPETRISYSLHKVCRVRLSICNLLGQEIRVLVNERQSEGGHEILWDGKDSQGSHVASGIYFCRLITEGYTQVRKMVLLR